MINACWIGSNRIVGTSLKNEESSGEEKKEKDSSVSSFFKIIKICYENIILIGAMKDAV